MPLLAMLSVCCAYLLAFADRAKVDNDMVHIVEVVNAPHSTRTMSRHECNRVLISLGAANIQRTDAHGHTSYQHLELGQVLWIPTGETYASENVGSAPTQFVEIELKKNGPANPAGRSPDLDPIAIDPEHNALLLENEQVRVFRSWREPGGTEKMHQHTGAGRVAVLLTDLNANVKVAGGSTSAVRASFGDVLWSGPVTHATTNLGSRRLDMVVVEVK